MTYRHAVVIYNPRAGRIARQQHLLQRTIARLEQQGVAAKLVPTTGPNTATTLARTEIGRGADLIIAAGGDGTLNEVANGMIHSDVPLAILPGGTANVLAHELKISGSLERTAALIPTWKPMRVSAGLLRSDTVERHFLLMAGVGLDAQIVYDLNLDLKALAGKLAYYAGGFFQILRPMPQFDAQVGGETHRCGFALISRVRNYGGDLEIARRASLLSPDFQVMLFKGTASIGYLRYLVGVMLRRTDRIRGCTVVKATSITCCSPSGGGVYTQIDGELGSKLPVRVEIVPDALTMLVPPAYLEKERAMFRAA